VYNVRLTLLSSKNNQKAEMNERLSILALGILGVFATSTVVLAPAIASTVEDFLNIINAEVKIKNNDKLDAKIEAEADIPEDGSGGAAGYGILTAEDALIVSTTHGGVYDSQEQDDADDPVWHNHLVTLNTESEECGDDPQVNEITFESPGKVNINGERAQLKNVPTEGFEATNVDRPAFDADDIELGDEITLEPGTDVQDVVSFVLEPQSDGDVIDAVCVTNIQSADNVDIK
jgi:hypothetical protein